MTTSEPISTPAAVEPTICATLLLPTVKKDHFKLRGIGGGNGYEFKWSEKHRCLAREYTDPLRFQKEEMDIRKNVRANAQVLMVVAIGSTEPLAFAMQGLETLIADNRKLNPKTKAEALHKLIVRARKAFDDLPDLLPYLPPDVPPEVRESVDPSTLQSVLRTICAPTSTPRLPEGGTGYVQEGTRLVADESSLVGMTEETLSALGWIELQRLGGHFKIADKTKAGLVNGLLALVPK